MTEAAEEPGIPPRPLTYQHSLGVGSCRPSTFLPSADGARFVCPSGLCVKQWHLDDRSVQWRMQLHDDTISALAAHAPSGRVASASNAGELRLWSGSADSAEAWTPLGPSQQAADGVQIVSAAWSACGWRLVTVAQAYHPRAPHERAAPAGELVVWDVDPDSHALTRVAAVEGHHHAALFAAGGASRVAVRSGERQHALRLLDADAGLAEVAALPLADGERVADVAASACGGVLAAVLRPSGRVVGVDGAALRPLWAIEAGAAARRVAFAADGGLVMTFGDSGAICLWDPAQGGGGGGMVRRLSAPPAELSFVAPWADERLCVARDGEVHRLGDGHSTSLELHSMCCCGLDLSPDAQRVACGDLRGNVFVWPLDSHVGRRPLARTDVCGGREHASVRSLLWTPDGEALVVGSFDGRLWRWAPGAGAGDPECVARLPGTITGLAWSHAGDALAVSTTKGRLAVLAADGSFSPLASFAVSPVELWSVAWAPDDAALAVACEDRNTYVVARDDGRQLAELRGHTMAVTAVAWARDLLVTSSDDRTIRVYAPAQGFALQRELRTRHGELMLTYLALDARARRVAVTSMGGVLSVFCLESGRELASSKVHHGSAEGLAWRGDALVTCGGDGVVNVFSSRL